jgi:hypothetical protein
MPGTTFATQKATCSTSAKKFSGLRSRVSFPTPTYRHDLFGQELRRIEQIEAVRELVPHRRLWMPSSYSG